MVWWGFVVGSRFKGCFHNFYERQVSHNIEGDVHLIKKSAHVLSKSYFLVKFNHSGNETCWKVWMLLFVDLLWPSMLFVGGWNFKPLPLERLKQIFFPLKDLVFPWPHPLFIHSRYGLVLPCCLVMNGQVHHIRQIMFSPVDVLLNTFQLQFTHCHHINSPNGRAFYPCDLK
jgi:hypothetical protein